MTGLTATDRETLRVLGWKVATTNDLAEVLGIGNTAAYQRLERLRSQGLVVRHEQAGTRASLYEAHDATAGRAAAMVTAVSQELPAAEAAVFARQVAPQQHRCVACGVAHVACCGLCPHWVPLHGEGSRTA